MQPMVNPFIFYLISVLDNLSTISIIVIAISAGLAFVIFLWGFLEGFSRSMVKSVKFFSILLVIFLFISIFVPSQEACYQMLVAYAITPDNIELVKDTGISIGDYIIENAKDIILTIQEGD